MFFWWRKPRLHYCAPAWNEERFCPSCSGIMRHGWSGSPSIDSDSTDGSIELLRRMPKMEFRKVPWTQPDSMIASLQALHNTCWNESRG